MEEQNEKYKYFYWYLNKLQILQVPMTLLYRDHKMHQCIIIGEVAEATHKGGQSIDISTIWLMLDFCFDFFYWLLTQF